MTKPEPSAGPGAGPGTDDGVRTGAPAGLSAAESGQTDHEESALSAATAQVLEAMDDTPAITAAEQRRVRQALSTFMSRVTAERSVRTAESAAQSALAASEAAALRESSVADARPKRVSWQPFRVGLLAGLGLLVAYTLYLSLDSIRTTLIIIAISTVLAIGLDPAVRFFLRRGLRRGWAVLIVFLTFLAFLGGVIYAILPPLVSQLAKLIESAPQYLTDLSKNRTIANLDQRFGLIEKLQNSSLIQSLGTGALSATFTLAGIAVDLVIVLVLTLYFLAGLPRITATGYRLVPATRRSRVTELGDKIISQLGGYLSGATIIAIQAGIVAGAFAWIVGLPYPWAVALGAALFDFIPVLGPIIIAVSMMLLGFTQSVTVGIVAVIFYVVQHMFETYWLYPRVMRRTVDISAGATVVAIIIGAALLGVTGALLAVPVAAAIQLIVREVFMPMQERN